MTYSINLKHNLYGPYNIPQPVQCACDKNWCKRCKLKIDNKKSFVYIKEKLIINLYNNQYMNKLHTWYVLSKLSYINRVIRDVFPTAIKNYMAHLIRHIASLYIL